MPQQSAKQFPVCRGDYENMRQRDKQGGMGSETCSDLLKFPGEAESNNFRHLRSTEQK